MHILISSIVSGIIGTLAMIAVLYLPALFGRKPYDTLGVLGSMITRQDNVRSRIIGVILLFLGGIAFAFFYGFFVLMFVNGDFEVPEYIIGAGTPFEMNLFYVIFGFVGGFCHGVFISLISTFVVTDLHPVERYRSVFPLIVSYMIGHSVFGIVVMVLQSIMLHGTYNNPPV